MDNREDEKLNPIGSLIGSYRSRSAAPAFDVLRPWKAISSNNIYIIYLSILLFAFYAFSRHGFNGIALSTSLIASVPVGVAIAFFETQSQEYRRKHRRNSFWIYLVYRTFRLVFWFMTLFFFIMLLVMWLKINTYETIFPHRLYDFFGTRKLFEFLGLALIISLVSNFMDELHRKLGRDAIYNLVLGKYHRVKQEERIFMFIDLNYSTDIAEAMGEMKYSHFLQDYFYDISEPIARYFGSIYQYVGDEAVVTWPFQKGIKFSVCLRCFFAIQKQIKRYQNYYEKTYGMVPAFKASIHGGTVVVSEVGKYKSEIAYHGDVLNTTARMLGKCHELESELLVSAAIISQVELPKYLNADEMGSFQLRGKQQDVGIFSVYMNTDKLAVSRKKLLLFKKKKQSKK